MWSQVWAEIEIQENSRITERILRREGFFILLLKNLIPETEDHRPSQDWLKVFSLD